MAWLQTFTGKKFDIANPQPEMVDILDIAHSLSMQCRFTGHTNDFYSVAEHSIYVSQQVPPEHALQALLHDASEAYLTDVARPMKPFLSGYYELEQRISAVIYQKFNLPLELHKSVIDIDNRILLDERNELLSKPLEPWVQDLEGLQPIGIMVKCLSPAIAKSRFILRFKELTAL
jgi:hypothetical protein